MKSLSRHIIRYDAGLTNINLKQVGGKGYNLFRLREYGFTVPPWFIVNSSTYEAALDQYRNEINLILSYTDFTKYNELQKSSSQIAEMIHSMKIDDSIVAEINNQFSNIIGLQKNASVRSSILDEDSVENSFAGLMDSYLNVPPEKITDTIKKIWASAFSLRALVYRNKKGLSFANISAAVIIQSMINSESSGVAFTSDPENISNNLIISAGYGLGEGIVLDSVETDTYRIDKASNAISNEIRQKDNKIVLDALNGTKCEELSSDKKSEHVLSEKQLLELSDVLMCIEEKFGLPQDVEWAYDKDGTLFILQSRPVIFKKQIRSQCNLTVWDNSNIIESYPGITLPLTFSFIRRGYEANFRGAILSLIVNNKDPEINFEIFKNMIGLIQGRVYYNLLNWYRMLSYLPNFESYRESWDQMIGISNKIDFPSNKLSLLNKVTCSMKLSRILLFVEGNTKKFYKYFNKYFNEYKSTDFSKSDLSELTSAYKRLENGLLPKWYLTLYSDITAMKYYSWLKNFCTKWGLDKYSGLHNDLLCGQKDIESVKPVKAIIRIAESITANKEYTALFTGNTEEDIWRNLETNIKYEKLRIVFASYLENYGDRCPEELKLEKHTYRESPKDLIRIVKSYMKSEMSIEKFGKKEEKINRKAIAFVRSTLGNPFKKLVFNFILRNARLSVRNRENMRFARSRAYGLVRRIFRRIGVIFFENHIINEADDIFYLTIDEVFGYIEGTSVLTNLRKLIDLRKSEFDEYSEMELDDRIIHEGIPYLNINRIEGKKFGNAALLKGIGCSSGIARAAATVVLNPNTTNGSRGCILVTRSTDPGWIFLMVSSKGIVTEKGSMLSHSAIMGREFGIPSIVNVRNATKIIADSAIIEMNGETGEIKCL